MSSKRLRLTDGQRAQKRPYNILFVSALVQLRNVDPMVSSLTCGVPEARAHPEDWGSKKVKPQ